MPHTLTSNLHPVALGYQDEGPYLAGPGRYRANRLPVVAWGEDNLYPNRYLELLSQNALYHQVAKRKAQAIVGDGFVFVGRDAARAQAALEALGLNAWLEAAAWDVAVFNAYALRVQLAPNGRPGAFAPLRISQVRALKPDHTGAHAPGYATSADWRHVRPDGRVPERQAAAKPWAYPAYGQPKRHQPPQQKGAPSPQTLNWVPNEAVFYTREYSPAAYYYPQPAGEACYRELALQGRILGFQESQLENGIASSMVIEYPKKPAADPSQEAREQREIADHIQHTLAGNANAGKATIVFYDPTFPEAKPGIRTAPQDDADNRYPETNRLLLQQALIGLGVIAPELFGILTPSGFSSEADKLRTAWRLTYHQHIRPAQDLICRWPNRLLQDLGLAATAVLQTTLPVLTEQDAAPLVLTNRPLG